MVRPIPRFRSFGSEVWYTVTLYLSGTSRRLRVVKAVLAVFSLSFLRTKKFLIFQFSRVMYCVTAEEADRVSLGRRSERSYEISEPATVRSWDMCCCQAL